MTPTDLRYHRERRELTLTYPGGQSHVLSAEFLRVHSPSAEVRGHGEGQAVLQVGKEGVGITAMEPVGNYGLKISFSDGHATGIYSWAYLHELGEGRDALWAAYLEALAARGVQRKPG
jgi:DUF971 family protein